MTNQRAVEPEREGRPARRIATPFLVMIILVVIVMVTAMLVARPWEGGESTERSEPITPTVTR